MGAARRAACKRLLATFGDDLAALGPVAVERLVGRAPAASLSNVCFPGTHAWHLRRWSARNGQAAHF